MSISSNIEEIRRRITMAAERVGRDPEDILLLAVTKLHGKDEINQAIDAGITDIGENKVQEILDKYEDVKPVRWHLIGHLQTNKVKYIIDKVEMIHSVDSLHLAKEVEKRAAAQEIKIKILIQVNPVQEETKFGLPTDEVIPLIGAISEECPHIDISGLMCIAPFYEDVEDTRPVFAEVKTLFDEIANQNIDNVSMDVLSMGMTGDYEVAIEEGSNCVRVGTAIFGNRDYRSEER